MLQARFFVFLGISCLLFNAVRTAPFAFQFNESVSLFEELTTSVLEFSNGSVEDGHGDEHSSLHLASWNYDYVAVPLNISLFILLTGLVKISN